MPMRNIFTLLFHLKKYGRVENIEKFDEQFDEQEMFEAPEHCVNNVLNFARAYRVADSENAGKIEMILN
jgi:hypothetical protein